MRADEPCGARDEDRLGLVALVGGLGGDDAGEAGHFFFLFRGESFGKKKVERGIDCSGKRKKKKVCVREREQVSKSCRLAFFEKNTKLFLSTFEARDAGV